MHFQEQVKLPHSFHLAWLKKARLHWKGLNFQSSSLNFQSLSLEFMSKPPVVFLLITNEQNNLLCSVYNNLQIIRKYKSLMKYILFW